MTDFSWHRRALDSIAHGYMTTEKRASSHVQGIYPTHLRRGRGCFVWDAEGKRYLDFMAGQGTNILGYGQDKVNSAITSQLMQGVTLSLASTLEVETAEKLKQLFPWIDAVRFLKTDAEARAAASKIAWGMTGKPPVEVTPIVDDMSRERIEALKAIREECTRCKTLLVFNEIDSGFRFPKYSASSLYGIEPDLIVLGGALASGMPLAAVGGKYSVMNGDNYDLSCSFAGEALSLAAAKETMTLLQTKFSLDELWLRAKDFQDQFNAIWPEGLSLVGYPTLTRFKGDLLTRALFFQEACRSGVLFGPTVYFNFPHIDEYKAVLGLCRDILMKIRTGGVTLQGEMPKGT